MIRPLVVSDAETYVVLRREALDDSPFAFGSSPSDDRARSVAFVREALGDPRQAVFGAFDPELVGIVGLNRELSIKTAHKTRLWGLHVRPVHRGCGLGRSLVEAAIGFARSLEGVGFVQLSVSERAEVASALYESLGFVTWGVEPAALRFDGANVAERHMQLVLLSGAA